MKKLEMEVNGMSLKKGKMVKEENIIGNRRIQM